MTKPNDRAVPGRPDKEDVYATPHKHEFVEGLTKREYFAAMAMQGIAANPNFNSKAGLLINGKSVPFDIAAVIAADALIHALNKKGDV